MKLHRSCVSAMSLLVLAMPSWLPAAEPAPGAGPPPDLATLQKQIDELKAVLPGQAHVMVDVDHHFANLWYAAQAKNWPLASFYMSESRLRIAWAVRLKPVRPLPGGGEIDLRPLQTHIEQSAYADLKKALDGHDVAAFEVAYRKGLTECQDCHAAIGKPFLKPAVPSAPGVSLIAVEPE